MGSLLLAGAWLLMLGGLGALVAFALLSAPPPSADPVQVALPPPPPAMIVALDPPVDPPAEPAATSQTTPDETTGPEEATAEDGGNEEAPATADGAEAAETGATETGATETGTAETGTAEAGAAEAGAPETETAGTSDTAAAAPAPPEAADAPENPVPQTVDALSPTDSPSTTSESTAAEAAAEAGVSEDPATAGEAAAPAGTGEAASVALPQPKPAAPAALTDSDRAATPNPGPDQTAALPDAEAEAPQSVSVPIIPPAPEDLPYWERFRQPFNTEDQRPRIAVVLTGLGLSDSATQAAIDNLPPAITLSFSPYARGLERWIALARARGHEVMIDLPMEPASFPNDDPGPQALLTSLSAEDNLDRLDWVLSRGSAYVGVAGTMGSRFTASREHMETLLGELKSRGLIFLDNRTTERSVAPAVAAEIGLKSAFNNRSIDERQASRVAIDARLAQIERIALSEGSAVAMAQPYPVTLQRLAGWATEINARGMVIAPISALVGRQESR